MANISIGRSHTFGVKEFNRVVFEGYQLSVDTENRERLRQARRFVNYLLEQEISVYGLTTGLPTLGRGR